MPKPLASLLSRFSRVTTSGLFIPEIDGLRFLAISSVVLYHVHAYGLRHGSLASAAEPQWFRILLFNGQRGVPLFFVISGFILGLPFAAARLTGRRPVSLRAYFLRRLTRLEPPYIVNMLVCFLLLVVLKPHAFAVLLPRLAASIFYVHNLVFGAASAINDVAWSLEIEVQFYCLVPLLAGLFSIRWPLVRRGALLLLMGAGGAAQYTFLDGVRYPLSILAYLQFFLAGFLLADIYLTDWNERPRPAWAWDLCAIFCCGLTFLLNDPAASFLMPFLVLLLYLSTFQGVFWRRFVTHPLVTTIGGMCYSIYLFHTLVISAIERYSIRLDLMDPFVDLLVQTLIAVPPVLACSALYFVFVERPCMSRDWVQRLLARFTARQKPVSANA